MNAFGLRRACGTANRFSGALRTATMVVASVVPIVFDVSIAEAQIFRPFRSRAVVVRRPVVAVPVYRSYPTTAVRIRTPYFAMSIGGAYASPPDYPLYGYRLDAYDPLYRYRGLDSISRYDAYRSPYDYLGELDPRNPYLAQRDPRFGRSENIYRPGANGGIPDVTEPESYDLPPGLSRPETPPTPNPYFTPSGFADDFDPEKLRDAASILSESIRRLDDSATWLNFLRPSSIISGVAIGADGTAYRELSQRFEGVVRNQSLARISLLPGFDETRRQLAAWVRFAENNPEANESLGSDDDQSEPMPVPRSPFDDPRSDSTSSEGSAPADNAVGDDDSKDADDERPIDSPQIDSIELLPPPIPQG